MPSGVGGAVEGDENAGASGEGVILVGLAAIVSAQAVQHLGAMDPGPPIVGRTATTLSRYHRARPDRSASGMKRSATGSTWPPVRATSANR